MQRRPAVDGPRIDVCALFEEKFGYVLVGSVCRRVKRRPAVDVPCVDIRSFRQEHLGHVPVPPDSSGVQRSRGVIGFRVDICSPVDELPDLPDPAGVGRIVTRFCQDRRNREDAEQDRHPEKADSFHDESRGDGRRGRDRSFLETFNLFKSRKNSRLSGYRDLNRLMSVR